jgi:propanol-preferring alcohol dehydrogenase
MVIDASFAFKIPAEFSDLEAAPLLCACAIGYRALMLAVLDGQILGLSGFGASGHLVLKMAKHLYPKSKIFVFARNPQERQFALQLGANWVGDHSEVPPDKLNAFIDTTPVWNTIVLALRNLKPGGRLVINAIRKESIDQRALLEIRY